MIRNITTELDENLELQILSLFETDIDKFSLNVFTKEDLIFPYLSMKELIRTRHYLSRITAQEPNKVHLLVKENNHNQIIGYILYHKHIEYPNNITIISTSVYSEYRGKGLFKEMLNFLKKQFDGIILTCCLENVPIFKSLGFNIECAFGTHVGMNYNCKQKDGNVIGVDEEFLNNTDVVLQAFKSFKNSNSNWQYCISQLNNNNNIEAERVLSFVEKKQE